MSSTPGPAEVVTALWQALEASVDAAAAKPSRARFEQVGQDAVAWMQARRASARDATSHSASEVALYKGNGRYYADAAMTQELTADEVNHLFPTHKDVQTALLGGSGDGQLAQPVSEHQFE